MGEGHDQGAIVAPTDELCLPDRKAGFGEMLRRLAAQVLTFDGTTGSRHWIVTVALASLLLAGVMIPSQWTGNEINYFDLSLRFVRPESLSPLHATYDASNARFVSFAILGFFIDHLGFETAHVVLGIAMAVGFAVAFAYMADAIGVSRIESLAALALFLALKQKLFVHEWIFGGVEAKTFAYAAIFVAIGLAWKGRGFGAVILAALATYFHFLVGGFWGAAILLLIGIRTGSLRKPVMPFLLFTGLVLPMFLLLLREQMMGAEVAGAAGPTASQIYSQIRNFRLVAPFLTPEIFLGKWLPGLMAAAVLVGLMAYLMRKSRPHSDDLAFWLFALNGYLALAMIAAFLDRHTSFLGPFYIFRPAALTLLLSLMATFHWLRLALGDADRQRRLVLVLCIAALGYGLPRLGLTVYKATSGAKLPIAHAFKPEQREMIAWIRENTTPDAVVLIGPWAKGWGQERKMPWVAFEHILERPTLVNFKFVPTRKDQIVAWYGLLHWRDAVFAGNCNRLAEHRVDYLVALEPEAVARLSSCGTQVWSNGAYTVLKVSATPSASAGEGRVHPES